MSELFWYIYQQKQQMGPFAQDQIVQLFHNKMIAQDAYLFKVGWKDWLPLEACFGHLEISSPKTKSNMSPDDRIKSAPRATISGRVIVHNNGQLVIGKGINISATGIFIETTEKLFATGELLKLSVKVDGLEAAFNVEAEVIRFNSNPKFPLGYGIRFINLPVEMGKKIENLVNKNPQERKVIEA